MVLAWGAATDVGRVRTLNEDAFVARPPLFVVADGMGGHDAGEVASALTIGRLESLCGAGPTTIDAVSDEMHHINGLLTAARPGGPDGPTMGTTAVGLALVEHVGALNWLLFNVGDSRAYRVFAGAMVQLSRDHSHVQDLVDRREITAEEARRHPHRNVVTRALGADPTVEPDYWVRPLLAGERFVLCSDGLSGEVTDADIEAILTGTGSPDDAATALVDRALAGGGRDNVTVVVVDVVEVPAWPEATTETRDDAGGTRSDVVVDLADGGIAAVPTFAPAAAPFVMPSPAEDPTGMIDIVPPTAPSPTPRAIVGEASIVAVPFEQPSPPRPTPPAVPPPIISMPPELASGAPDQPHQGAPDA